ncbi:MAG TPA: xanthine dehydrogenase accessory protein XdhC [Devosiaceae bacterium]|jgi:xanthine dehydrogenase accessory factor
MITAAAISDFAAKYPVAVCAELTAVRGSSPRAAGTFMLIAADDLLGTIGGGALEHLVIERARKVMREGLPAGTLDVPLGPEIGQCCGGRVEVALMLTEARKIAELQRRAAAEAAAWPDVFVFGAGHVGRALARALALLPVRTHVVDTRQDELAGLPGTVELVMTALPEAVVRSAPRGSAYVILTHDHALDFLIAEEALKRTDAPYVGMVGSRTKRARFKTWYLAEGGAEPALERLVLPIGAMGLGDKRPEVIAALAAAEIMVHIGRREVQDLSARPATERRGAAVGR